METDLKFCKKLVQCVKEYRKQQQQTADDIDCAYFYDKKLKQWLWDHKAELDVLATVNFEKSFMTFVKHYLFDPSKQEE